MPRGAAGGHPAAMRRRWFWGLAGLAGLGVALLVVGHLRAPSLQTRLVQGLRRATGLEATVSQLEVAPALGTLRLRDLRLVNPPEFGGGVAVNVPELHLAWERAAALRGHWHFRTLQLHLAELNLVRHRDGRLNLQPPPSRPGDDGSADDGALPDPSAGAGGRHFGGIDRLVLTWDRLTYTDLRDPDKSSVLVLAIDAEVATDLKTAEAVRLWLTSLLMRIAIQEYLKNPAQSRMMLLELLLRGVARP